MSDYKKLLGGLTGNGISVTVSDLAKYMSSERGLRKSHHRPPTGLCLFEREGVRHQLG